MASNDEEDRRRKLIEQKIRQTDKLLAAAKRAGVNPIKAIRDAIDAKKRQ